MENSGARTWALILVVIIAVVGVFLIYTGVSKGVTRSGRRLGVPAVSLKSEKEEKEMPDFNLKTLDGETFTLSEQRGKVVVMDFWATWCPPCKMEVEFLKKLRKEYGDDVVIVGVNVGESEERVKNFVEERGVNYVVLLDEDKEVAKKLGVRAFPTTFVLGPRGEIITSVEGFGGSLESTIKEAIGRGLERIKSMEKHEENLSKEK